jgi:His-Xaa-Ser system protein HxsD
MKGSTATADVDPGAYSEIALKKAAYRFADRCTVVFGPSESARRRLEFVFSNTAPEGEMHDCVRAFFDAALDYDLRERISAESAPLRNLILAHAFSRTKLVRDPGE